MGALPAVGPTAAAYALARVSQGPQTGEKRPAGAELSAAKSSSSFVTSITLDGIGPHAVAFGRPHSGLVRLVGMSAREQGPICVDILSRYAQELAAGAIVTVEPGRVRIRPPAGEGGGETAT